jgi:hypothetical protein
VLHSARFGAVGFSCSKLTLFICSICFSRCQVLQFASDFLRRSQACCSIRSPGPIHARLCSPLVWLLQLLLLISPHWSWLFHLVRQSPARRFRLPRACLFWWLRDARFIQAAVGRILILPVISDCRVSVEKAAGQRSRVSSQQRKNKPFGGVFHYSCVFSPKCHRKTKPNMPLPVFSL